MQRLGDTPGRGFEPVEGGVSAGGEFPGTARQGRCALASGAEEILNRLVAATPALAHARSAGASVVAVTDQGTIVPEAQRSGMNGRVRVQEVVAIGVRTGKTLSVDALRVLRPRGLLRRA